MLINLVRDSVLQCFCHTCRAPLPAGIKAGDYLILMEFNGDDTEDDDQGAVRLGDWENDGDNDSWTHTKWLREGELIRLGKPG